MFSTADTIVAIATPPGRGGIGVVRVSGPDAHAIARALIAHATAASSRATRRSRRPSTLRTMPRRSSARRRCRRQRDRSGRRHLLSRVPHSYTGDDVVEISAHGSPVVLRAIVARGDRARARGWPSRASSRCARF